MHSTRATDRRIVEWRDAKTKVLDHRHEYALDAAGYEIRLIAATR